MLKDIGNDSHFPGDGHLYVYELLNIQFIVVMLLCYVFLVENLSFAGICPKWSQMAGRAGYSPGELKNFRARPSGQLITFLISNPASNFSFLFTILAATEEVPPGKCHSSCLVFWSQCIL